MTLLERQHVLVVPGSSFNVDYTNRFRITFLPDEETLATALHRIEATLAEWKK
jgi:alanine-synthesizing transaminase